MKKKLPLFIVYLLGVLLIILKFIGIIDWNWIFILSPIWVPTLGIVMFLITIYFYDKKYW
jgi:hypothetical protein